MTPLLTGALLAGLLGGPHCVGMCGPFATAAGPAWHLGRLTTYGALGTLAGAAGRSALGDARLSAVVSIVLLSWFAAGLAGFAPRWRLPSLGLSRLGSAALRAGGLGGPFGFGVVSGLLPCGLLWSALALAVPAGTALGGAFVMTVFWVATLPALAVASQALRCVATARPWTRRAIAAGVLATGLVSVGLRASAAPGAPACHEPTP